MNSPSRTCSTGQAASCRPAKERVCRSPKPSSIGPRYCCPTSPPPRSIPIRPIGCGRCCNATAPSAASPSFCLPRYARGGATVRARHHDGTPARLLAQYGRHTLEEVFLDVARGRPRLRQNRSLRVPAMKPGTESAISRYLISGRRVAAMIERYWYLLRSSWPRLVELVYWPAVQLLMWASCNCMWARTPDISPGPGAPLSARCRCGTFCCAASSAFRCRFLRRCGRGAARAR